MPLGQQNQSHASPARGLADYAQSPLLDTRIEAGFRVDLMVNDKVIVEAKSVEGLAPVHKKQLLIYLRLADKRLGLLINLNFALIKDGITRIVNGMKE